MKMILACLVAHFHLLRATNLGPDSIIFPGKFDDSFKTHKGHLKPFGWQHKPENFIKEYRNPLPAKEFYDNHVKHKLPLVYRGIILNSPAINLWSDNYLNSTYGELDVLVELKKENRDYTTGRMRLKTFLQYYKEKELYIVSLLPKEMMEEIQAVSSILCGTFKNFTHESNFWMSNGGTCSVIHYDADENLHCLLTGRKDFILVENRYKKLLYMLDQDETSGSSFSQINPDSVDLHKYPRVTDVPYTYVTLSAGDCVYIPAMHIHQVRSYTRTLAVTTLFTKGVNPEYDNTGCETFNPAQEYRMSDIDFHWTYSKGDSTIDMGYMNIEVIRHSILRPTKALGGMNLKSFERYFIGFSYGENVVDAKTVFNQLIKKKDKNTEKIITVQDVISFSREDLKLLARALDPPHGPKTEPGEEVFFLPGEALDNEQIFDEDERKRAHEIKENFDDDIQRILQVKKIEL